MMQTLRKLFRNDDGASMVEYTVLLGLVLAVTIGLITTVGTDLSTIWTDVGTATTEAAGGGNGTP